MTKNKECFFIAPINEKGTETRERTDKLMDYVVSEAVKEYEFTVIRSDRMDTPGSITSQVIGKIVNSELVIADLTDHNPNVFYELAVRHATGKPFIQLIKEDQAIPFDIHDQRTIYYDLDVEAANETKEEIQAHLESLESDDFEAENPVSRSADMQSLRQSEDSTDQNLADVYDELSVLTNKIDSLSHTLKQIDKKRIGDMTIDHNVISVPIGEKEYAFNKNKPVSVREIKRIVNEHDVTEEELTQILGNYDLLVPDM